MDTNNDTFSITDLRHQTSNVLNAALARGYVVLMRNSRPHAAVVDINYLKALQEAHEEQLDIDEFDKTIALKRISLSQHKSKMR